MLGGRGSSWVGMSVQNELLGDVPEHSSNGLNLHLMSVTVPAFPDGDSKGEELVREDVRVMDFAGGILIESAMRLPRFPGSLPCGPIHCRSANRFPRRVSKTLDFSQRGTAASVHCCCSGRGKVVLNDEQKSGSERGDAERNNCWAFVGRDAMSAITFSTPGT